MLEKKNFLIYKFVSRYFFSTNHKCGVLVSLEPKDGCTLWRVCNDKLLSTYRKFNTKVKRLSLVDSSLSIGKQTSIIATFFGEAGNVGNLVRAWSTQSNSLLCGVKEQPGRSRVLKFNGNSAVISKSLGGTFWGRGSLRYDHKGGIFFSKHLGMYKKFSGSILEKEYSTTPFNHRETNFFIGKGFEKLRELKSYKGKSRGLIDVIADSYTLITAYKVMKSNRGNMTAVRDNESINGISRDWFESTALKIKNGSFQFKAARRVLIPKSNKLGFCLLTVSNRKDKIVQQAIRMVLEQIYEPLFLRTSHGFRPSRGCHSALEQIKRNWTNTSWFLEFDIYKCYDSIDRHRLTKILSEKIDDQRFIDLICKLFDAGIVGWKKGGPGSDEVLSQGSILYPILCNIYLHRLDLEAQKIYKEYWACKLRRCSDEYIKRTRKPKSKKFLSLSVERQAMILGKRRSEARKLGLTRTNWNDHGFVRVRYVRYVDDFILGISGPKDLVVTIKKRLISFVQSDLKLELSGGEITHIASGKIKFLGMLIHVIPHSKFPKRFGKDLEKKRKIKNRLSIFRNIKDVRLDKVVQLSLKKAVNKLIFSAGSTTKDLKLKKVVQAIWDEVRPKEKPTKETVVTYKDFIRSLTQSNILVPYSVKKAISVMESLTYQWEKDLVNVVFEDPKLKYNNLMGCFESLSPQIDAPLKDLRDRLRSRGIISKANKPTSIGRMIWLSDELIVQWFTAVGRGLLNYYCCCNNFYRVKDYVNYMVRWSAIHTLAAKHCLSCRKVIVKWTKNLVIEDFKGHVIAKFPSNMDIRSMGRKFLPNVVKNAELGVLETSWTKFTKSKWRGI